MQTKTVLRNDRVESESVAARLANVENNPIDVAIRICRPKIELKRRSDLSHSTVANLASSEK